LAGRAGALGVLAVISIFVAPSFRTFGGASTKQVVATVTPTPSSTTSQLLHIPVSTVSLFGFKTPIPAPFGAERTGYLVKDIDLAIKVARAAGADVLVDIFPDPIGRDAVIQWPGGVNMQPYGREITGYEVADLQETLAKPKSAGVSVLVEPIVSEDRSTAMLVSRWIYCGPKQSTHTFHYGGTCLRAVAAAFTSFGQAARLL